MAGAGGGKLTTPVKLLTVAGCGVVVAGCAYYIYRKIKDKREECTDEGFEDSPKNDVPEKKVLMLGLDGAGKSSVLSSLGKQDPQANIQPTEGFNVMCVQNDEVHLSVWEIGGKTAMRDYWEKFLQDTSVLCYVVDTADRSRLEESAKVFKDLLNQDELKGVGIIVIGNKQDIKGAATIQEVKKIFGTDLCVIPTQVPRGAKPSGIEKLEKMLIEVST